MAGEWKSERLADLCEQIADCPHSTPAWTDTGVLVLRNQNIRNGRLDLSSPSYTDQAHFEQRSRRARLREGDLVLTREAPMGEICRIPKGLRCCLGQRMVMLRPSSRKCDSHYLLYAIQSPSVQHEIRVNEGTGSTVSNLRIPLLESLPIPLPSLPEQKRIAHILGTLDDKIELNRRMNATLEAMARALFQSWFVDFDPVRRNIDRAQGRTPSRSSETKTTTDPSIEELDNLFPSHFQDSPLGPIPQGWEVVALKDLTSKIGSGATPRGGSAVYTDEGVALIRSQNVHDHDFRWDGLARLSDKSAAELANVEVKTADVLLNITGDSILRTCVVDPSVLPARVNQHVAIIRAVSKVPPRYLHLYMVLPRTKEFLIGLNAGATRPAVTKGHLDNFPILRPSRESLDAFESASAPVFRQVEANLSQTRNLAALRAALLPRLLSGVSNADLRRDR